VIENPEPFVMAEEQGCEAATPTIMCNNTNNAGASVTEPLPTVTTGNRNYLMASTIIQYHSETSKNEARGQHIENPIMTVDTANRYGLVFAFIAKHYGGGYTGAGSEANEPIHTVTAIDHNSLVTVNMEMDEPLGTVTTSRKHHTEVLALLTKYCGNSFIKSTDEPLHTITAKGRFAVIKIYGENYVIADICMRMLQPRELFAAMGFPKDYIIDRDASGKPYPKSKQTARCGNAVTPQVPEALVRANLPEYCK
jgi:DNA (cytosine-5)-methyltransferase 1